jgi:hypothetical protein
MQDFHQRVNSIDIDFPQFEQYLKRGVEACEILEFVVMFSFEEQLTFVNVRRLQ